MRSTFNFDFRDPCMQCFFYLKSSSEKLLSNALHLQMIAYRDFAVCKCTCDDFANALAIPSTCISNDLIWFEASCDLVCTVYWVIRVARLHPSYYSGQQITRRDNFYDWSINKIFFLNKINSFTHDILHSEQLIWGMVMNQLGWRQSYLLMNKCNL